MKKFFLVLIFIFTLIFTGYLQSNVEATSVLDLQNTYVVLVGVLTWKDKNLDSFSPYHRKDVELYQTLLRRGVPQKNIVHLIDAQATLETIKATLKRVLSNTNEGSDFIFFYSGHGLTDDEDQAYIANYDILEDDPESNGLSIKSLGRFIAKHFNGDRVILFGDFCYSGALQEATQIIHDKGYKSMSLASAQDSSLSTGNWTFTQTLIDTFNGLNLADLDRDGKIVLSELSEDVASAMKYREFQRHSFSTFEIPESLVIANVSSPVSETSSADAKPSQGSYVLAKSDDDEFVPARVLQIDNDKLQVEFYDYSDKSQKWLSKSDTVPIQFKHYPINAIVQVNYEDKFYSAKVLKHDGDFHFISYTDKSEELYDEWILSDRIQDKE